MIELLSKYFAFAQLSFKTQCSHRMKFLFRFIICCFFMMVFIELWRLIGQENLVEIPYSITDLGWYTALTQMLLFLSPRLFMVINEDVRSGDIAYFLIRPIPYLWMRLSEGIGGLTAHVLIYYSFGMVFVWLYIGALPSGGLPALLTGLLFVYFGSILHLVWQVMTGISALWFQDSEPMYRIYQKLLIVLGGLYMPVSLYPAWAEKLSAFTPFYTMLYLPARSVLDGNMTMFNLMSSLGCFVIWFILSFLLMGWIYRICVHRLEVNGG